MINHRGKILDRKEGKRIIACTPCGYAHVMPLLTQREVEELYREAFYTKEKPNYFKETRKDLAWWLATYDSYYRLFERHTKGRRLLDVGSGPGHFLRAGEKRAWKTLGFEPSHAAANYAKKHALSVVEDLFSFKTAEEYGTFDVVHASMVLEHVVDPLSVIRDMRKMAKREGLVAILVPNDYSPLQSIARRKLQTAPWWVAPRHHLNYFTPGSLERLMQRAGLKIIDKIATFPLELFLLIGENYVGNNEVGRIIHGKRKQFDLAFYRENPELLENLYRELATMDIGREVMILATPA